MEHLPQQRLDPPRTRVHAQRGRGYAKVAEKLYDAFGFKSLSVELFDEWAETQNIYIIPRGVEKKSEVWIGHTHIRNQLITNINKASQHPRMWEGGRPTYQINNNKTGELTLQPPNIAEIVKDSFGKLLSFNDRQMTLIRYAQESINFDALPERYIGTAIALARSIRRFTERLEFEVRDVHNLVEELQQGQVPEPPRRMLSLPEDEGDDDSETMAITGW